MRSNIKIFYLFSFVNGLGFSLPIFTLYFLAADISYFQLTTIIIGFNLAVSLFEIPSGAIADRFGRRNTIVFSRFLWIISMSMVALFQEYYTFLIGWFLNGVAYSMMSGADSALLYDSLKDEKRENEFKKIQGGVFASRLISMGLASVLGGYIADHFGLGVPFLMMIAVAFMSTFVSSFLKEPKHKKQLSVMRHFKEAIREIVGDKIIIFTIILFTVTHAVIISNHYLLQPYMKMIGIDLGLFGIIYLGMLLCSSISSYYAQEIDRFLGVKTSNILLIGLLATDFMVKAFFPYPMLFVTSLFTSLVYGYMIPYFHDIINKRIASTNRATVISISSFTLGVFVVVINPLLGILMDTGGLMVTYGTFGAIIATLGLVSAFLINFNMKEPILKGVKNGQE